MTSGYLTAFEVLGVPEDATDELVRDRFALIRGECGGDDNDVPARVRDAFAQLAEEGSRTAYLEVLSACREVRPLIIAAVDLSKFLNTCTHWQIEAWRDLNRDDIAVYHVWQPTDDEPAVVAEQRRRVAQAPPGVDPFRWGRLLRRLVKPLAALAVIVVAVGGWTSWSARAEAKRQADLANQMRVGLSNAEHNLAEAQADRRAVFDEFQALAGFGLAEATADSARPRVLDLALIRHESVRKAWDELLAEHRPERDVLTFQSRIAAAGNRLMAGNLTPADAESVGALDREIAARATQLSAQRANLRHIREMLEADRLERTLEQPERSAP